LLPILVELSPSSACLYAKKQLLASSQLFGPLAQTVLLPDGILWNFVLATFAPLPPLSTALQHNNGPADIPVTGPHKER
jgi:hypothetical protein